MRDFSLQRSATVLAMLLAVSAVLLSSASVRSQEQPVPVIDAMGHTSTIRGVAFLPNKRLVSVSEDKTIRIWDQSSGKLLRTIRGQIGEGRTGALMALAVSPDGKRMAVAVRPAVGCPENCGIIRIHELASGKVLTVLKGHENRVLSLAWSPDGRSLVSGSRDYTAIVWDMDTLKQKYILKDHQRRVTAVAFSADSGFAITASLDRKVRVWDLGDGGKLYNILSGHSGNIYALAASPVGFAVASGSADGTIKLWDGLSGELARTIKQGSLVASLSFSPDGRKLLSGSASPPIKAHVWHVASGEEVANYAQDDSILANDISPDGRLAVSAGGTRKQLHIWELDSGLPVKILGGVGTTSFAVAFSKDGKRIAWGKQDPCPNKTVCPNKPGILEYELALPRKDRPIGEPRPIGDLNDFERMRTKVGRYSLAHRADEKGKQVYVDIIRRNRRTATIETDRASSYEHTTYTFSPDGRQVVIAGYYSVLRAYDRRSRLVRQFVGHTSTVANAAVSPDGRLLASVGNDQILRLWNFKTGEHLVSLFHGADGEWIMWTPEGHFTASPKGAGYVGWQVNKGDAKLARFISAGQLRQHLHNPEIVRQSILTASLKRARPKTRSIGKADFSLDKLQASTPPAFKITSPADQSRVNVAQASLSLLIEKSNDPVNKLEITVNGKRFKPATTRGFKPVTNNNLGGKINVPLLKGANHIHITASNATGETVRKLTLFSSVKGQYDKRGVLYLLAIGVDEYPHFNQDLDFAGADARAFYDLIASKTGALHKDIKPLLLTNKSKHKPTKNEIEDALGLFFKDTRPEDTIIIFLAGHGDVEDGNYYFLPTNARRRGKRFQPTTVVKWRLLQDALKEAQGMRIMFVDTCHSAGTFKTGLKFDTSQDQLAILAASSVETEAQERRELGHGVFTHAILQGLNGAADSNSDGKINFLELALYVSDTVALLTRNQQIPWAHGSFGGREVLAKLSED